MDDLNGNNSPSSIRGSVKNCLETSPAFSFLNCSENGSSSSASLSALAGADELRPPINAKQRRADDFIFLEMIGEGSFSTVYRVKEIRTGKQYATKVCEQRLIIRERKTENIVRERHAMAILTLHPHPFIVQLYYAFKDSDRLYFVMELARNGDLLTYLNKLGSFDEDVTRFYAAEIVSALEHMHKFYIIHRDLKPENILLNDDMHILISDFGSAKILESEADRPTPLLPRNQKSFDGRKRRCSFVGTAEYVSPEVINGREAGFSCDYWALGCIVYQMLAGLPPFRAPNEYLKMQKVQKLDYSFPDGFLDTSMKLVKDLLQLEPSERLGDERNGGVDKLKSHDFFDGIDWSDLPNQKPPDILPYLPATSGSQSFHSRYKVPENIQSGLDDKQITRLLGLQWEDVCDASLEPQYILNISQAEREKRIEQQKKESVYHRFVEDNLIFKMGLLDKRKGLFARRRMFLLTEGPHLYYVDPANMEFKGQIPWYNHEMFAPTLDYLSHYSRSKEMRIEGKNFQIFFVHTPNRTYYLQDPASKAYEWCDTLEQVRKYYFCSNEEKK